MRIVIDSFRGEAPRVSPRLLPPNAAQDATNARLQSGDLEAWRQFALTRELDNPGTVETIYLLNDVWLSWEADVDVARGAIAGDESYRAYITGPDVYGEPRYTDYALATSTGSSILPVVTRPLGVPNPASPPTLNVEAGPSPDIAVSDAGDQLSSWITSGTRIQPGVSVSEVEEVPQGNPAPSYRLRNLNNVSSPAYAYRDFGVGNNAVITMVSQFNPTGNGAVLEASWRCACTSGGAGVVAKVGYPFDATGGLQLLLGQSSGWGGVGSWQEVIPMAPLDGSGSTWYTSTITVVRNANGTCRATVTIADTGGGVLASAEITALFPIGGFCGVEMVTDYQPPSAEFHTLYDNFAISGSGVYQDATANLSTSYVYTFVNDLDQESGPSEASVTIARADGVAVTVTTPTAPPSGFSSDYGIERKRIYRAVTGATGTVFRFVAEIPLGQATYEDTLTDVQLGEVLQTELWALPPADMRGMLALPNGIMVGFSKNQLCFSAQNYPHAWPVEYRLNTDTAIVGIGNIDNTVVIGTEAFPYLATGNDPASYSMSKLEVPQACVAKRSFAYLTGIGVIFASPDGLLAVGGNGQVRNLTEGVFTRRQWQALEPETILAVAHDNIYFLFSAAQIDGTPAAYALDVAPTGFGLVRVAFHASAVYADPLTDKLYMMLDGDDEPTSPYLPLPSTAPVPQTVVDPYFDNPGYLLHFDGANGSQVFTDEHGHNFTTAASTLALSTDDPLFGTASLRSTNVSGDVAISAVVNETIQANNACTLEGSFRLGAIDSVLTVAGFKTTGGFPWFVGFDREQSPGRIYAVFVSPLGNSGPLASTCGVLLGNSPYNLGNTVRRIAGSYDGTTARLYLDDVLVASAVVAPIGAQTVEEFYVWNSDAAGFLDESRVTLNAARYTSDTLTPQTEPFPDAEISSEFTGTTIYEFDSEDGDGDMVYRWRGKLNLLERPACFQYAQIKADDYANLMFRIFANGEQIFERVIASHDEFTLPTLNEYETVEIELLGTSRVRTVQIAESVEELA